MSEEKKYPETIVGALVINKEGKILLAKSKKWDGKYTVFGGHVELGETLEDAIIREVKEESGLDVEVVSELGFGESIFEKGCYKKKHFVFVDFLCVYEGSSTDVNLSQEEYFKDYLWIDVDDALKMDVPYGTRNLIKRYGKYLEAQKYLDSWKRCKADFENFKKSQEKSQKEFRKYALSDIVQQILPILDNFESSLSHVPEENKETKWVEGIIYIKKQIKDMLRQNGVEEIEAKPGEKFNPEVHEAVSGKGEKVKKVLQKGYRLNGRVIRATRVEVE